MDIAWHLKKRRAIFEVLTRSFLCIQPLRIYRGYSLVMLPREQLESTKVVLVLHPHQGVPLHHLTTEIMMCFQGRQTTSMKLLLELHIQVTCRRSLPQRGPMTKTMENLPGSRPARENRHGRVRVMFQRGTKICKKESRCQCRQLKNLSLILYTRNHLMVNNGSSTYEFCLFCNPVDVKLAIARPKQASLKRLIGIVIFTVVDWNWLVMEANALYLKRLPTLTLH